MLPTHQVNLVSIELSYFFIVKPIQMPGDLSIQPVWQWCGKWPWLIDSLINPTQQCHWWATQLKRLWLIWLTLLINTHVGISVHIQCNIPNCNHHEGAEIQGVSINTNLTKALADYVSQNVALTISHTLKDTTALSYMKSRRQTQTTLSGTDCSWFSVCALLTVTYIKAGARAGKPWPLSPRCFVQRLSCCWGTAFWLDTQT